jgi:predicted RecA/RadA family phage recombinase
MTVNATLLVGQDPNDRRTFIAHTALEANRLVTLRTADPTRVEYPSGQFGEVFGITEHAAEAGKPVEVLVGGFGLLKVDGTASGGIAIGSSVVAHTNTGLGQVAVGGAAGNRKCIGFACSASTADGDLISVEINKHLAYFAS